MIEFNSSSEPKHPDAVIGEDARTIQSHSEAGVLKKPE
jgi:hypothetical protein